MSPPRRGSVRQRGNRWQARLQLADGTTRSHTFADEQAAEDWVNDQGTTEPTPLGRTFHEWAGEWQANLYDLRPSSLARAQSALRSQLVPEFGALPLDAITCAMVRRWMAKLIEQGLAPTTVTRLLRVLGSCLQVAADDGLITTNPARGIRPPRADRAEQMFLDATQVARLAGTINPAYRGLVFLGAYGGLRIGELLGLKAKHLNPLKASVQVVEQVVEVSGIQHIGPPKTTAGRRTVPLPRSIMDTLAPHLEGKTPEALVFPAAQGGYTRRTLWAARTWRPAAAAAGLDGLRIHDLRHTAVALWIAAGASPLEVTKRAGHTSSAFVLDRYGHLYADGYDQTTARLEQMAKHATTS